MSVKQPAKQWIEQCAPHEAIIDLGKAFGNVFTGRAPYPRFKKRGVNDAYRVSTGTFHVHAYRRKLPNIGWVKSVEPIRWSEAKCLSVTVSKRAEHFYASISCENPDATKRTRSASRSVIEDLSVHGVHGMAKNHHLATSIRDVNTARNVAAYPTLLGGTRWQPVESSPPLAEHQLRHVTSTKQESEPERDLVTFRF